MYNHYDIVERLKSIKNSEKAHELLMATQQGKK